MSDYYKLFGEYPEVPKQEFSLSDKSINEWLNSKEFEQQQIALQAYQNGDLLSALKFASGIIGMGSRNPFIFELRATIKQDMNEDVSAVEDFKETLSLGGGGFSTYNQIAISFMKSNFFELALVAFDIAIEGYDRLALLDHKLPGIVDGVVRWVEKERMLTNRANSRLSLNDFQGCMNDCQEAIAINPSYSFSYVIMGLTVNKLGRIEEAISFLREAEKRGNKNAPNIIQSILDN